MESAKELAKVGPVTSGGFPETAQKGLTSEAPVAAPAGDPDSSSSDTDDMSDHCQGGGRPGPEPVPESLPRLSIKVPLPKKFRGDREDLKPEAFDGGFTSVQLHLRLYNLSQNAAGSYQQKRYLASYLSALRPDSSDVTSACSTPCAP